MKIVDTERLNLRLVENFVKEMNVDCNFRLSSTFDVCFSEEVVEDEERNIRDYLNAGGSLEGVKFCYGDEAKKRTRFNGPLAVYEWPAASIHPVKLTHWLLKNIIGRGVEFRTHCPVTSITEGARTGKWDVHTSHGVVSADRVAHCTNAYAGYLLQQLSSELLTPIQVQVHSLVPSASFSGSGVMQHTVVLRESPTMFYGLAQMDGDGTLIVSVGRPAGQGFNESSFDPVMADEVVERLKKLLVDGSKVQSFRHGEGLEHSWTGLISFTPDKVPYVGEIQELRGQFICAGFNGHGMANIFSCAAGIAGIMLGQSWESTGLPECYQYSLIRLTKFG